MSEILIGQYLFRRLKELGIETIFGVPGDFELALLDLIEPEGGITWRGTPNELVGAYAADGYARVKGAGALITTFGPGELSALCGIGGAFCEFVPVVHIVGYPTSAAQASGNILHHTLGDKSYDHYIKMSGELSVATTALKDASTAPAEIDRVLNAMLHFSQPAYIGIPENIAYSKCSTSLLDKKLVRSLPAGTQDDEVVGEIVRRLESAKNPILMVDGGAGRHSWEGYVEALVEALNIPHYVTTLGKGIVNEEHPLFGGAYAGLGSWQRVIKAVSESDLVLWLGNLPSDFNTGMFTEHFNPAAIVDLQRFFVKIGGTQYDAKITYVLPKLIGAVKMNSLLSNQSNRFALGPRDPPYTDIPSGLPGQDWFWERLSSFLAPGDAVISETGTSQVGILGTTFKKGVWHWTQAVYGSIGYAAGAAVGASIASQEAKRHKRLVLITGEGSLQLTVQAFSILNRHGITPLVFVINNHGYTVERYFCGMKAGYNDVPGWDYCKLYEAFSPHVETKTYNVTTGEEMDKLLSDHAFQTATVAQLVEVHMHPEDLPKLLKGVFDLRDQRLAAAKAAEKK